MSGHPPARAVEIDQGVSAHLGRGSGAELMTLTARHALADEFGPRLAVMTGAIHYLFNGSA